MKRLIALTFAMVVMGGASVAQATRSEPGYTDFPNALRVADEQRARVIPGYTDFPNALRLTYAGVARTAPPVQVSAAAVSPAPGFGWGDAGIGAGTAIAALLLAGGLVLGVRRRGHLVASP
jgi:hypothetical protein